MLPSVLLGWLAMSCLGASGAQMASDSGASWSGRVPAEHRDLVLEALDANSANDMATRKDAPWLGVAVSEASDVLASQLKLDPGVGLVVTFVTPESPAAKEGLQEKDVLVRFEEQPLVHPSQLRKLVQVRKDGDVVRLMLYRGGAERTVSVTLGKTPARAVQKYHSLLDGQETYQQAIRHYNEAIKDWSNQEPFLRLQELSQAWSKVDQKKLQEQIKQNVEAARKAIEESVGNLTNLDAAMIPMRKALQELSQAKVLADRNRSIMVRSTGKGARSVVKADDSGTIVLVSNPKLHLTAHDKDGKLLFDGEIATDEQRAKVPREVWEKVEPLLGKMGESKAAAKAEEE